MRRSTAPKMIMRILAIAPTPFFADRGCHIRIYEQMKALRDKGNQVTIIAYGQGRNVGDINTERIKLIWQNDPLFGQSILKRMFLDFLMIFKAIRVKKKFKPDIIHCYLHNGFLIGYISSFFSSKKIIFDCQGSLTSETQENGLLKNTLAIKILKIIEKFVYKKAPLILVSSGAIKKEIEENYGVPESKILIVKDGPMIKNDSIGEKKINEYRNKMSIPAGYKAIIYTGILSDSEGLNLLLEAIQLLKKRINNFFTIIAGYPDIEKYKKTAEKRGIGEIVNFFGKMDYFELPYYLAAADIAVAPKISQTESHGKIINYLSAGLPVVCFKSEINQEIAGQYALYAEEITANALCRAMEYALINDDELSQQKEERKKFIREQYEWRNIALLIKKAYQKLLI